MTLREQIKHFYDLLDSRERKLYVFLVCGLMFNACIETSSVVSILPFLTAATNPELIHSNQYLLALYNAMGCESDKQFLMYSGIFLVVLLPLAGVSNAFFIWFGNKYCWWLNERLSTRFCQVLLRKPYTVLMDENSANVQAALYFEITETIRAGVIPITRIISRGLSSVLLLAALVYAKPMLAFVALVFMAGAYKTIYLLVKARLKRCGEGLREGYAKRLAAATEAFTGIKLHQLMGMSPYWVKRYSIANGRFSKYQGSALTLQQVPRYLVESAAFTLVMVIALVLIYKDANVVEAIPALGFLALAGYKLVPNVQTIYQSISSMQTVGPLLENILRLTSLPEQPIVENPQKLPELQSGASVLAFDEVGFSYETGSSILEKVSFEIFPLDTVGIMGTTGSGKTTLVDLIMGLIHPNEGSVIVHGEELSQEVMQDWQNRMGYVPQETLLIDDSIAANIAYGVHVDDLDMERVIEVARIAQIHEFIDQLPEGYQTRTGERGVKLSGGQRQRISIARALYRDPEILIFDEATSALDDETEAAFMEAIETLRGMKTLFIIAHRLSTLRSCTRWLQLDQGSLTVHHEMPAGVLAVGNEP